MSVFYLFVSGMRIFIIELAKLRSFSCEDGCPIRKQRERDKEKDAWCEEHGYQSIRICYKDKALIPELLLKYIKNPDDFVKKHYRKPVQYAEST